MGRTDERIAVIGLGYVGLPTAIAFAEHYPQTIGFDSDPARVEALRGGSDRSGAIDDDDLRRADVMFTSDATDLGAASLYAITVPTPLTPQNLPDLTAVQEAARTVGRYLSEGDLVVVESTVYPGVTEDVVGPILAEVSGLSLRGDFQLGYAPERVNPGDEEHRLANVVKVVSARTDAALERVAAAYGRIVPAGLHRAPSIKVAEMSKLIENTQRDLNIALMNELALICSRLGIRTSAVLEAARTKWNFLPFEPGLVGGHCIGIDPYYLTAMAQALNYHPQVVLAGRRVNDSVGTFIAQRTVKLLSSAGIEVREARVGILGLAFKADWPDLRNSRVADIVEELHGFGIEPLVHDPLVDPDAALMTYGMLLDEWDDLTELDALIVAVKHTAFIDRPVSDLTDKLREGGVLVDVKSVLDPRDLPTHVQYWSL